MFHLEFRQDLRYWIETERKVALRAFHLIGAILRDPFTGIGKPEPLKYLGRRGVVAPHHSRAPRRVSRERRSNRLPPGSLSLLSRLLKAALSY